MANENVTKGMMIEMLLIKLSENSRTVTEVRSKDRAGIYYSTQNGTLEGVKEVYKDRREGGAVIVERELYDKVTLARVLYKFLHLRGLGTLPSINTNNDRDFDHWHSIVLNWKVGEDSLVEQEEDLILFLFNIFKSGWEGWADEYIKKGIWGYRVLGKDDGLARHASI